jgi:hypothetical protein
MRKSSRRTAILVAGALGALMLALPAQSFADPYTYQGYSDYHRHSSRDDAGHLRRHWRDTSRALTRVRTAIRHDRRMMQEQREAMYEARRRHDWSAYRHHQRELEQAKDALRRHQEQLEYARRDRDYPRYAFNR